MRRCAASLLWLLPVSAWGAGLTIDDIALHMTEDGPAVPRMQSFDPGSPVAVTFRVGGFSSDEESREMHIEYSVDAVDPAGVPVAPAKSGIVAYELAPEDKNWKPKLRYQIYLPARAAPGNYTFRINAEDKRNGAKATASMQFAVKGPDVPLTETFGLSRIQFLRSEKEQDVLPEGEFYAPGSQVWVRFEIAGFARGEKNRYKVSYGVELWDPSGKLLFAAPKAAAESEESFYPVSYVPAMVRLNLDPKALPGKYRLLIRLEDGIAGVTTEREEFFEVR